MSTPIKLLVITMGGERQAHIEKMFSSSPNLKMSFIISFSLGVPSRSLRSKTGFFEAFYAAGLLTENPHDTILANRKTTQKGTWEDMDFCEGE